MTARRRTSTFRLAFLDRSGKNDIRHVTNAGRGSPPLASPRLSGARAPRPTRASHALRHCRRMLAGRRAARFHARYFGAGRARRCRLRPIRRRDASRQHGHWRWKTLHAAVSHANGRAAGDDIRRREPGLRAASTISPTRRDAMITPCLLIAMTGRPMRPRWVMRGRAAMIIFASPRRLFARYCRDTSFRRSAWSRSSRLFRPAAPDATRCSKMPEDSDYYGARTAMMPPAFQAAADG